MNNRLTTDLLIKSILPFFITQSNVLTKSYINHMLVIDAVNLFHEHLKLEIKALKNIQINLKKKLKKAPSDEIIRLHEQIIIIRQNLRIFDIFERALCYSSEIDAISIRICSTTQSSFAWKMWFDIFCEIAKRDTEPWRKELLAKALVIESFKSENIGLSTLGVIGTIEKDIFYKFTNSLDIAILINNELLIPNILVYGETVPLPFDIPTLERIYNILINIEDIGLIKNINYSTIWLQPNTQYIFSYGNESYSLNFEKQLRISNAFSFTALGKKLARLYVPQENDLGKIIFKTWIKHLSLDAATNKSYLNK